MCVCTGARKTRSSAGVVLSGTTLFFLRQGVSLVWSSPSRVEGWSVRTCVLPDSASPALRLQFFASLSVFHHLSSENLIHVFILLRQMLYRLGGLSRFMTNIHDAKRSRNRHEGNLYVEGSS